MIKTKVLLAGPLFIAALGNSPGMVQAASFDAEVLRSQGQDNGGTVYKAFDVPAACNANGTIANIRFSDTGTNQTKRCMVFTDNGGTDTVLRDANDEDLCDGSAAAANSQGANRQIKKLLEPSANAACDVAYTAKLARGASGVFKNEAPLATGLNQDVLLAGDAFPDALPPPDELEVDPADPVASNFGIRNFPEIDITDNGAVVGLLTMGNPLLQSYLAVFRCADGTDCRTGAGPELVVKQYDVSAEGFQICNFQGGIDGSEFGVAFRARVVDTALFADGCTDPDADFQTGIFKVEFGSDPELVALNGTVVSGIPAGTVFRTLKPAPEIDNAGNVAILGLAFGAVKLGFLFYCEDGAACKGAVAEGAGDSVNGGVIKKMAKIDMADDAGDVAIQAATGIFSWDNAAGEITTMVANGDENLPGDDGPFTFKKPSTYVSISSDGDFVAGRGKVQGAIRPKGRNAIVFGEKQP